MKINKEIILIGGCHHNMLGIIRALGKKGIKSNLLVTNSNPYVYICKSKYVKSYTIINEDETAILKELKKYVYRDNKAILIPTSDFASLIIDKNLNKLQKNFIVPSINKKQGEVVKLMDKFDQHNYVDQLNIKQAKSWNLNLHEKVPSDVIFPCIIKPLVSADGSKSDITICYSLSELIAAIDYFKKLNYDEAILQEFIDVDVECGLIGCCHDGQVIIPGIIQKKRIFPERRGNVSFGKIAYSSTFDITPIIELMKNLKYSGMFDIEVFIKKNEIYLNEINFRNSGNSYAYVHGNVYIGYLWVLMVCGFDLTSEELAIGTEYYFEDEILEIQQLLNHNITFFTWIKSLFKSKSFFVLTGYDFKPILYKPIYAILRRLRKNEKNNK